MKAKNLLKQLLLVTLVLCISLLGTTAAVFSEEQTDAPANSLPTICLYGFIDSDYDEWVNIIHRNLKKNYIKTGRKKVILSLVWIKKKNHIV